MVNVKTQQGRSILHTIVFMLFLAIIVKALLNLAPIYLEQATIVKLIDGFVEEQGDNQIPRKEMFEALSKRFIVNGVTSISSNDLRIVREGNKRFLITDYSAQVPYFLNIYLLVEFDNMRVDITAISAI